MGTSASAHKTVVKSILIDQNSSDWNSRGPSASSRRSLPTLPSLKLKKGNNSQSSQLGKNEKMRLLDRTIKAEGKALDCENRIKCLEREVRTLELRNHDLSTEVGWLRQQCTMTIPADVPDDSSNSFDLPNCSEHCQFEKKELHSKIQSIKLELSRLTLENEKIHASDVRKDIRLSELMRENEACKARITTLEELCRSQISKESSLSQFPLIDPCQQKEILPVVHNEHNDMSKKDINGDTTDYNSEKSLNNQKANIRLLTSRTRSTHRNVITLGNKVNNIDGKVRPFTAVQSSKMDFVPPPLERGDTAPILMSADVLSGTHTKPVVSNDPYVVDVSPECSDEDDSDIDVTDILDNSSRSLCKSLRSQSGKSRDSGYSLGESLNARN